MENFAMNDRLEQLQPSSILAFDAEVSKNHQINIR